MMLDVGKLFAALDALEQTVVEQQAVAKTTYDAQIETLRRVRLQVGQCRAAIVHNQAPQNAGGAS